MRRYSVHNDFAGFFDWLNWAEPTFTMINGQLYNPETHDLVPKESYKKQLVEQKEKKLQALTEEEEAYLARLKEKKKALEVEIKEIKKSLSP